MGEKRKRNDKSHSEAEIVVRGVCETPEKRQKVESGELCTPQPLTRENLALLDGKMARKETGKGDASNTGTTVTHNNNIGALSLKLQHQGLVFCDRGRIEAPLVEKVTAWVTGDRSSVMNQEEAAGFEQARYEFMQRNEDDFILQVWSLLLLPTRTVKKAGDGNTLTNDQLVLQHWRADGLDLTVNQIYHSGSIPELDASGDPVLKSLLKELPRIKTPKPDRSYGLRAAAFTKEEQCLNDKLELITKVARSIYYTFFVVEFKSCGAPITEAQLQARRSGASLVYSMRQFKRRAGILNKACSKDDGSYVFSVAMSPDLAQLYMHWAVKESDHKVIYHMHELNSYALTKSRDVKELRRDVDNIMDWGVNPRKDYIKSCLAKITERDSSIKQATPSSKAASSKSKAASSKAASSEAAGPVPAVTENLKAEDTEDEDSA